MEPWVGDSEPRLVDLHVFVEEEVEIERPRPLGRDGRTVAAEVGLDGQEQVEELPRRALRLERGHPVEEARLIQIADRLRIDECGDGYDLNALRRPELRHRRADGRLAVAEVRAEPDIRAGHGSEPSSPGSTRGSPYPRRVPA